MAKPAMLTTGWLWLGFAAAAAAVAWSDRWVTWREKSAGPGRKELVLFVVMLVGYVASLVRHHVSVGRVGSVALGSVRRGRGHLSNRAKVANNPTTNTDWSLLHDRKRPGPDPSFFNDDDASLVERLGHLRQVG